MPNRIAFILEIHVETFNDTSIKQILYVHKNICTRACRQIFKKISRIAPPLLSNYAKSNKNSMCHEAELRKGMQLWSPSVKEYQKPKVFMYVCPTKENIAQTKFEKNN